MSVKEELLNKIDKLPDYRLKEVLQFVNFLHDSMNQSFEQDRDNLEKHKKDESINNTDPLTEFVGAVSHGSLAQNIDLELYG